MKIEFAEYAIPKGGVVVAGVLEDKSLTAGAAELDRRTGGAVNRALKSGRFQGRAGDRLDLVGPGDGSYERIVLAGLGKAKERDALKAQEFGGGIVAHLNAGGVATATLLVDPMSEAPLPTAAAAARIAFGARLRAYRFDKYRTKEKEEQKPTLAELTIAVAGARAAEDAFRPLDRVADGVYFARDLVSEPANVIYPETLADAARTLAELGVEVEVLGVHEMQRLGMGALLGVGQGSTREPRLVVMQWKGAANRADQPLAFVGKGVTFDTGGISIKPAAGMEEMKWDMGGAGTVIGLMKALAGRKAKINVVGVAGLVENMPSGTAQRPGDVVKSMSGQTIEVINTDAEGRLVLADALWYCQDRFKPKFMIDLATLTGAIVVALGHENAGLFANSDELAERIAAAGRATGERCWRLPLAEGYDKAIVSEIADMKNVGDRAGGSITAAQFLQRFVNDVPWAHIDIAGMAWSKKDAPTVPKGATAFGVQLLNHLVQEYYEGK
ncbi:MAG TPA: leucyl aminopeptidase [Alphaproteobacteria bacterium]|jgi:leucyl aminopeptidase